MRHWIVREREAERDRVIFLALDNALADPGDPSALADLERRISRCAGQALLLLSRGGEVGLVSRSVLVAASAGRGQRARILEALARLAPHLREDQLVILRSTVSPGTLRKVVMPYLTEERPDRTWGVELTEQRFDLHMNH